jgi:hypothetical protein
MAEELTRRVALSLVKLAETLDQITQLVTLGREQVETDPFLPLAAEQLGIRLGHDVAALPDDTRRQSRACDRSSRPTSRLPGRC